jgi:hypothetical protein
MKPFTKEELEQIASGWQMIHDAMEKNQGIYAENTFGDDVYILKPNKENPNEPIVVTFFFYKQALIYLSIGMMAEHFTSDEKACNDFDALTIRVRGD